MPNIGMAANFSTEHDHFSKPVLAILVVNKATFQRGLIEIGSKDFRPVVN